MTTTKPMATDRCHDSDAISLAETLMRARPADLEEPAPADSFPNGRALAIVPEPDRTLAAQALGRVGYEAVFAADPYAAMLELSGRPLAYRAVLLSLVALYPPELRMIEAIKGRFSHVDVFLADVEGRGAALAQAVRLGADALLDAGRLHRLASSRATEVPRRTPPAEPPDGSREAILTAAELRALLEGA